MSDPPPSWTLRMTQEAYEPGGKIIIIMTRWHDDDLAGRYFGMHEAEKVLEYRERYLWLQALETPKPVTSRPWRGSLWRRSLQATGCTTWPSGRCGR